MTPSEKIKRHIIGKKIKSFTLNPVWVEGDKHYCPSIRLENNVIIRFLTTEFVDGSDYGVEPIIIIPEEG